MFELFKRLFIPVLDSLNKTSIKRLIIYSILVYPLFVSYFFKDEVKMILSSSQSNVEISNLDEVQQRCFNLRKKYGAEAVILSLYQPSGQNKSYKERMIFSTGSKYVPLESTKIINLFTRSRILEEIRKDSYALVTQKSDHQESAILKSFGMEKQYTIPLINASTKEVIGEVSWIFESNDEINVSDLLIESQIFSYSIKNK